MPSAEAIHRKFIHLADVGSRPSYLKAWEKHRHRSAHWFVEMVGEAMGVFMFVFSGVGATMAFNIGTLGKQDGLGSLFTVGVSYCLGIVFAISICASVSGGHFSPAVTISFVIFKGFPPLKAIRYIIAQILGAYIACLLVYTQYYDLIQETEKALMAAGLFETVNFSPHGIAGVFALYAETNLKHVFINEFVCDFVLGVIIWGALDPTNFFTPPQLIPWVIASAYLVIVVGYAPVGIAANAARDVGGRLAAITIWGLQATGGKYAALAALTSIPATILAAFFYEVIFTDSSRVIVPAHREFLEGHEAHMEHRENDVYHNGTFSEEDDKKA